MAELVVGLENNQKILIPTSSEARSGNPLGSFLLVYGNTVPIGYLPLETLFDENQYPALYAMLGTNKTPDTPCDLGADWSNKQAITFTNNTWTATENGWIVGYYVASDPNTDIFMSVNNVKVAQANTSAFSDVQIRIDKGDVITFSSTPLARTFNFVPFKKYAHVVIKATSGLEETQQDYVLQSLLEADSYSTEEVATGKKWIDGKMIYRKTFYNISLTNGLEIQTGVNELINQYGTITNDNTVYVPFPKDAGVAFCTARLNVSTHKVVIDTSNTYSGRITLEYTKAD